MLRPILALVLATLLLEASALAQGVRTPGYRGTSKAPPTKPITPMPKPSEVGGGADPTALVDAGGTAHVAWNGNFQGDTQSLGYCRIKRGNTTCDNPQHSRSFARGDIAAGRPHVVAFGDTLMLLTQRTNNSFNGGPVLAYVSENGGESFQEPVQVGGYAGDDPGQGRARLGGAVVYGAPGAERIGLVFTGGYFQTIRPGTAPGPLVDLFPEDDHSNVAFPHATIAPAPGNGMVVAIQADGRKTALRTFDGTGDAGDLARWAPRRNMPGQDPWVGGSQAAAYLQTEATGSNPGRLELRKLGAGGVTGAPIVIAKQVAEAAPPLVDSEGDVRVAYPGQIGKVPGLVTRTLDGGAKPGKPSILVRSPKRRTFDAWIAALPDGGGFVTLDTGAVQKTIVAAAYGSQAATGAPSLGGQPGGGGNLDPKVLETCTRIKFSRLSVEGEGGCMLQAVGDPGTKVAEGTLNLNGLEIVPDKDVKILLNSRKGTFDTTGKVTVQLRIDASTVVPLMHDELHLELPSEKDTTEAAPGCKGVKLLQFDASKYLPVLQGFPIKGDVGVYLGVDSACIPLSLALPASFLDVRGAAVLKTTTKDGLDLDTMKFAVANVFVGPLLVEDLTVEYARAGNQWDGKAKVGLPPQPGGVKLGGSIRFKNGAFDGATIVADPPFPGLPLFGPTFLTSVGGGFNLDPFTLRAEATVAALPLAPGVYTLAIHGKLVITFGDPVVFDFTGSGEFMKFPFATARVTVTTDGFFGADADLFFSVPGARVHGKASVFIDIESETFSGRVEAEICVFSVCPGGEAIVSSIGMGACVDVELLRGGFGYKWGDTLPELFFPTCDLDEYEPPRPAGAPAARAARRFVGGAAARFQAEPGSFPVAAGAPVASIKLIGQGGPPSVTLVSPSGQRIVPTTDVAAKDALAYATSDAATNSTYVGIFKPAAGAWKVEAQPGSPAIAELRQALPVAEPNVKAELGGKGRKRRLAYRVETADGLTTTFIETDARGNQRVLGTAKKARGTLRFSTGYGAKGRRTVTARTDRDGIPRLETKVGTYVAPAPQRPGRPGRVRVARARGGLVVKWRKTPRAAGYAVTVKLSDGRRLLLPAGAKARTVRVAAVPRDVRATVSVVARDRTGRAGRAGRGKTRRSNRRGGAR